MLIKEYHILLPMSLDEYQVAQLYMIQVRAMGSGDRGGHTSCRNMQAALGQGPGAQPRQSCSGPWKG